jgi:hypothetical protein
MRTLFLPILFLGLAQPVFACEVNGQTSQSGCTTTEVIPRTDWTQDLIVREPTLAVGIFDHVTLEPSTELVLTGTVRWTVTVDDSSKLTVRGMAQEVVNQGGLVEVRGMVDRIQALSGETKIGGTVGRVTGQGKVLIKHGAVVSGKRERRGAPGDWFTLN